MSEPNGVVSGGSKQRVFPLHLSPIETFMFADDQPDYPMTFVIQLQLSGEIDRGAWEAALDEALDRHPLLRASVAAGKGGLPCWVLTGARMPLLEWGTEGVPIVCPRGERIDLDLEIGLRVWIRQGPQQARVVLQFHHACCDGTGAYRFIGDLLAAYGLRTAAADQRPEFSTVEPRLLRNRKQHTLGLALTPSRSLTREALRQAWRILIPRPAPLAKPHVRAVPGKNTAGFPGFLSLSFDRAGHQQLRDAAGRYGVSPNDLLLRDLFLSMACWNQRQRSCCPGRWLRIMMPTDLRGGEDIEMPASNMTSYTFLTRRMRDCRSPESLLQSIRHETALIKHHRSGTVLMDAIFAAANVRGLLPFLLHRNLCMATAVLSNAADPSRRFTARFPRRSGRIVCGNLVLDEITGVPPLRRKTRATVSISQYDRRLTISLRCDPYLFRQEDTAALLELYAQQLRASAKLGPQ